MTSGLARYVLIILNISGDNPDLARDSRWQRHPAALTALGVAMV
jgi:hypothetical protein